MQITVNVPNNVSLKRMQQFINETEAYFKAESIKIAENKESKINDPWMSPLQKVKNGSILENANISTY